MDHDSAHIWRFQRSHGNLPHWEEPGATYFVTLALRRPPVVDLTERHVAQLVVDALRFFDCKRYWLFNYTVMADHVHAILKPIVRDGIAEPLSRIMYNLKHWLAREINRMLGRSGALWQTETYDHVIRNEQDYAEKAAYVYDNPRRAGFVDDPAQWPWWGIGSAAQPDR